MFADELRPTNLLRGGENLLRKVHLVPTIIINVDSEKSLPKEEEETYLQFGVDTNRVGKGEKTKEVSLINDLCEPI